MEQVCREIRGVGLSSARRRLPVGKKRNECNRENRCPKQPAPASGKVESLVSYAHFLGADERGTRFPHVTEPERGPHAPPGIAPEVEVIAVANFARDCIAQVR